MPKLHQSLPFRAVRGHRVAASSLVAAAVAGGVFASTVGSTPPVNAAASSTTTGSDGSSTYAGAAASAQSVAIPAVKPSEHPSTSAPASESAGRDAAPASEQPLQTASATAATSAASPDSPDPGPYAGLSPQQDAAMIVPGDQLDAFDWIIDHESSWNVTAENPSSGAYGLGQALPAIKMAPYGSDYLTDPVTQIKWALAYMDGSYGSPDAAQAFWESHGWY
ncbi:MAG TPA: transglycosylase SLT domain-containing protein [Actinocrinis sp.]